LEFSRAYDVPYDGMINFSGSNHNPEYEPTVHSILDAFPLLLFKIAFVFEDLRIALKHITEPPKHFGVALEIQDRCEALQYRSD
jgi:hypothetical protein